MKKLFVFYLVLSVVLITACGPLSSWLPSGRSGATEYVRDVMGELLARAQAYDITVISLRDYRIVGGSPYTITMLELRGGATPSHPAPIRGTERFVDPLGCLQDPEGS
jgi:hypothetical protein